MKHLVVKVNGNIIVETEGHIFHYDMACYGADDIKEINKYSKPGKFIDDTLIIDGDLVLDETTAVLPYASYVAMKDISVNSLCRPSINVNSWSERNKDILNKANIEIPEVCKQHYYNGLFLSLCSSFELAVMDILLMKITTVQKYYDKAVKYWLLKTKVKHLKMNNDKYFISVIKYFTNTVVYHRFGETQQIYKDILDIDLPNFSQIETAFRKRNNIVHRYSISNLDRITITNASYIDIVNLEKDVGQFLNSLEERVDPLNRKSS